MSVSEAEESLEWSRFEAEFLTQVGCVSVSGLCVRGRDGMSSSKSTRSRAWMVTIFEQPEGMEKPRTEDDVDDILSGLRWCGQLEEGHETHRRHFQLYVEAKNAIRFSTWKRLCPDAHVEPREGSKEQAIAYVTKEDTRVAGPFFHGIEAGDRDRSGERTDLREISERILGGESVDDLLLDPDISTRLTRCLSWARSLERARFTKLEERYRKEPRDISVFYIWGAPGIGKTYSVLMSGLDVFEPTYAPSGGWDDYAGQDTILFDEFNGQVELWQMNRWLNGYPRTVLRARYRNYIACYHTVFIVSNHPPEEIYGGDPSWLRRLTHVEHAHAPMGFLTPLTSGLLHLSEPDDDDFWAGLNAGLEENDDYSA